MKQQELTSGALAAFCRGLHTLIQADVETADALGWMADESAGADKALLLSMKDALEDEGLPLWRAMKDSGCFPRYVWGMVEVGERSGRTGEVLRSLAEYYEGRVRLERRIKSALLYPAVMLLLMLAVIGVLLVKVLPIFDDVYASLGGRLTGVAGGLLALGRWIDKAMPALFAVLALAVVFAVCFAAVPAFRGKVSALWRGRGGDKGVRRKLNDARLAKALAVGMSGDLEMDKALELASGLMADVPAAKGRCDTCLSMLEEGKKLGAAMTDSGLLPAASCRLLMLAERGGKKVGAMDHIAQDLMEEGEAALEEQVSRVEPALVLVCSVLVGLILLSVMLPLMHIMSAIG